MELCHEHNVAGDGRIWDVPLGPPIVHVSINDLEDKEKIDVYRGILLHMLYVEQENITYRRLGVHYSRWPHQYTTNEYPPQIILGFSYAWNTGPGANTPGQIQALTPIVIALSHNYKAQNRIDELKKRQQVFELIHDVEILDFVKLNIPELFS